MNTVARTAFDTAMAMNQATAEQATGKRLAYLSVRRATDPDTRDEDAALAMVRHGLGLLLILERDRQPLTEGQREFVRRVANLAVRRLDPQAVVEDCADAAGDIADRLWAGPTLDARSREGLGVLVREVIAQYEAWQVQA